MAVNWSEAPEVRRVAEKLIAEFHQTLQDVRMEYLHRDDHPKEGDRDVLGRVRKVTDLAAFLASGGDVYDVGGDPFFAVWVPEHVWQTLKGDQRVGLVDHLLCYCRAGKDDEGTVKLQKVRPDFEGFYENIKRCGFWQDSAAEMFEAMRQRGQLRLDLGEEPRAAVSLAGMDVYDGQDEPMFRGSCGHEWPASAGTESCPLCGVEQGSGLFYRSNGKGSELIDGPAPAYAAVAPGGEERSPEECGSDPAEGAMVQLGCGHWVEPLEVKVLCVQCEAGHRIRMAMVDETVDGWEEDARRAKAEASALCVVASDLDQPQTTNHKPQTTTDPAEWRRQVDAKRRRGKAAAAAVEQAVG